MREARGREGMGREGNKVAASAWVGEGGTGEGIGAWLCRAG